MNKLIYKKRTQRIRRKLKHVNKNRFRLSVYRSSRNISAQIIDDKNNKTLVAASSVKEKITDKNNQFFVSRTPNYLWLHRCLITKNYPNTDELNEILY